MNILDLVVGKPIKTSDERAEQIGAAQGIPIFGLDALSSAAYGPEAALSLLIPLGLAGVRYILPISAAIITRRRSARGAVRGGRRNGVRKRRMGSNVSASSG